MARVLVLTLLGMLAVDPRTEAASTSSKQQVSPGDGAPPPSGTAGVPPPELWSNGSTQMGLDEHFSVEVHAGTSEKKLYFDWVYLPFPPTGQSKLTSTEEYSLTYWPTEVVSGDGLVLYVAGRRPNGKTVIEKWAFSPPDVPPPGVMALDRTSVQTLYNASVPGRKDVVQLAPMLSPEPKLLVLFHDSKEVWALAEASGSWQKVASPTDGSVLLAPELAEPWYKFFARDHVVLGAMYTLGAHLRDYTVTLVDVDKDGTVDSIMVLTTDEWGAQGFSDASNYRW